METPNVTNNEEGLYSEVQAIYAEDHKVIEGKIAEVNFFMI